MAIGIGAPPWPAVMFGVLTGVFVALYVVGYVYFGITQPDALRSESYTLRKMAIEKGLAGDNVSGLTQVEHERGSETAPLSISTSPPLGARIGGPNK